MMDFIEICSKCGGKCCFEARPPISNKRLKILMENGIGPEFVEFGKYKHLKLRNDGYCVLFENGKCKIHEIKPETCVAGPITFDIKGGKLELYIKKETICPLVKFLKENEAVFREHLKIATEKIVELIKELDNGELEEILKIEEPETEKILEISLKELL
ncbi:MAG: YkgJ family cysteine cluster protein [Archaeoglobales archaeon]|nr:YkgJ family cysteine cluster protein [Archaeoglobales archaeon]